MNLLSPAGRSLLLGALLFVRGATAVRAHDYWLEPSSFAPRVGERVTVVHRVGERLAGEAVPRNPFAIVRFDRIDSGGGVGAIAGVDGVDPAGWFVLPPKLPVEIVYQGEPSFVELEASKFEAYLVAEGLEAIRDERRKLGEDGKVARESFSRSAKAWVCGAGESSEGPKPEPRGLDLEIVADRDLCSARAGEELGFRLLRAGRPVAGVLMMALDRAAPDAPLKARTDADGRFRFRLPRTGFWLVKGVRMERLPGDPRADWRSHWASLTFALGPGAR